MNDHMTERSTDGARVADIDFERDLVNIFQGDLVAAGYGPPAPPPAAAADSEHRRYRDDILYKWLHLRARECGSRPVNPPLPGA
jgi:hypothetical protein